MALVRLVETKLPRDKRFLCVSIHGGLKGKISPAINASLSRLPGRGACGTGNKSEFPKQGWKTLSLAYKKGSHGQKSISTLRANNSENTCAKTPHTPQGEQAYPKRGILWPVIPAKKMLLENMV